MRRRGDKKSLQEQLFRLREENDRLREIAYTVSDVEKLKQENKAMRLEMQKIAGGGLSSKMGSEDESRDDQSNVPTNFGEGYSIHDSLEN